MANIVLQRNLNVYNVKDFGALGNGINDDTADIQTALTTALNAGGGTVSAPAGNYLISSPLVIGSNVALRSLSGVTYTLAANSNCNMIKNVAVTPQRTVTDAAITTGTTTLTSATANFTGADVGRTVGVAGAWQGGNVLIANITVVTNSTTVTLSVAATASVSNASCSIYSRDSYIEISGGYWQRGSNGYPGGITSSPNYQTTQFRHVDVIYIHDLTVACAQKAYQVSVGDVTNYTIKNITSVCSNSIVNTDVVNVHGPAFHGLVDNIYGVNGDDFVSVHSYDGDGNLRDTIGNVTDLMITNLFPNGNGQASFKTHGGQGTLIRSLTVRGIHGASNAGAFHIADTGIGPPSDNNVGDIIVEDVDVITTTAGLGTIYCNNSVGTITLRNLVWRQALASSNIIAVSSGNSLRNLIIDGVQLEAGSSNLVVDVSGSLTNLVVMNVNAPDTSVQFNGIVQVESGTTINTVSVLNCRLFYPPNVQNTIVTNKGNIKNVVLDNIYMNNGGIAYAQRNSGSSNSQVLMSNITLDSAYQLSIVQASATCDYAIHNLNAISMNQSNFIGVTGTGASFTMRGNGLINPNNYGAFSRDGTQTPRIVFPEMQVDLSTLAKNNGDIAYNTNASLACGVGVAISNGSNWKNIYSGSVY